MEGNTKEKKEMNPIMKQVVELLKVKSLMSLIATYVFTVLALSGKMDIKDAMIIILLVYNNFFQKDQQSKNV